MSSARSRPSSASSLHPGFGVADEFGGIGEMKLVLEVLAVGLDGFNTQVERSGHLASAGPGAEQLEDLQFPVRQALNANGLRLRLLLQELAQDQHGHFSADIEFSGQNPADGL